MARRPNTRWEDMDKSNIDLSILKQHYEVNNKTEGKSPKTVSWYNEVLHLFLNYLKCQGMSTSLEDVGEWEVRQFILHLQEKPGLRGPTSSHTIANRVRALRAFFAWVHRKGYTQHHVLQDLKVPKTKDQVIEPLTPDEIRRIFAAINPRTVLGSRNTALLSLMLDTGLRLSEVATLKDLDVHFEDRYVKVLGKGDKPDQQAARRNHH